MINMNLIKAEWTATANSYIEGWNKSLEVYSTMTRDNLKSVKKIKPAK
jgi:hypothetical protein